MSAIMYSESKRKGDKKMSKWIIVKNEKNEWRIVEEAYGVRSLFQWAKDYSEAYKLAKAMGFGKEPKVEE